MMKKKKINRKKDKRMIKKIVEQIIEKQVEKQKIINEDVKIYRYGYILMFEVVLNIILALMIGIIFKNLGIVLFFLCMYIPLRSFCGGWHANNIWKCTIISNAILIIELIGLKYIVQYLSIIVLLFVFFVCTSTIIVIAPVETKAKRIGNDEKQVYRKKIYVIIAVQVILMAVMIKLKLENLLFAMVYVYLIQAIMLLIEKIKQQKTARKELKNK